MGDVISYGGDASIVATRAEIERVQQNLMQVGAVLTGEVELTDFIVQPLKRVGLAMELPAVQSRLQQLLHACQVASDEYFDGEALISQNVIGANLAPIAAFGLLSIANRAGLLSEGEVRVAQQGGAFETRSPNNLATLVNRLIQTDDRESALVRIEKYSDRYLVYVPGTQTWNPIAGSNVFDVTSNVSAMSGANRAASELGVQRALQLAGVRPDDAVYFIGHSQGGMVAANIAANAQRQKYRVAGLVTFGSPLGQLANKIKVPTISLEHNNDLVPKLGLKANPLASNWVTVSREAPTGAGPHALVEAHELSAYRETAKLTDESNQIGITNLKSQLLETNEQSGTAQVYKLQRD